MAADRERLIRGAIRTSEAFLRDLQRFFIMPTDLLKTIADKTEVYPYRTLSDAEADDLAHQFGEQAEDVQRIAAILLFLKERLTETGQEPLEAILQSRDLLGQEELARGREDEIAAILSYSEQAREEALALRAFSDGPTFMSTRLRPSLLPAAPSGTELVGGYFWTISYLNTEGEQRSITVGLTPGELEHLETTIERAKEQLGAIRGLADSTRTTED